MMYNYNHVPDYTIMEDENTRAVSVMASTFSKDEFLIGHANGDIHLWRFLKKICSFIDENVPIVYIHSLSKSKFLSANKKGVIKIWNKYNRTIIKKIFVSWWILDYMVMLPQNLIAFSKFRHGRWVTQTVEVWDIKKGFCVHTGFQTCARAQGMPIDITIAGYLVVATTYGGKMCIWDISKKKCKLICSTKIGVVFSLAALPTNEIVTASRDMVFYTFNPCGDIYKTKVIPHTCIIDIIIPVAGYKFFTIDRSQNHAGLLKLWCCATGNYTYLGVTKYTGVPRLISSWYDLSLSYKDNKLFVKYYNLNTIRLSEKLAEIRKNVRILAQAVRTNSSSFIILPPEIIIEIALMTAPEMNQQEKKVSRRFAWSHFCRPHFSEKFIHEKAYMRDKSFLKF